MVSQTCTWALSYVFIITHIKKDVALNAALYVLRLHKKIDFFLGGAHHLTKYMALLPAWFMWKIEKPAWYDNSVSSGFEITIQFCVIET